MGIYLGIDFGTSTNYVTCWNKEKNCVEPVTGLGEYGKGNVFPNVIYYDVEGSQVIGAAAQSKGAVNPENCVNFIKRHLEEKGFSQYIPNLGRKLDSVQIASDIFCCLKKKIEDNYGGEKVEGVVISVPFAFQHAERGKIKRAAENAGMKVLGLIEEPVAATLSFGLAEKAQKGRKERVLVFDLGGGTFDVTIFNFVKQTENRFAVEVLGTDGAKKLGGIDIDDLIVEKLRLRLEQGYPEYRLDGLDAAHLARERQKMQQVAISAKENISRYGEDDVYYCSDVNDEVEFDKNLDREDLDSILNHSGFLDDVENVLDNLLEDLELDREKDIDRIILVGGTSNIPSIQETVKNFFHKEPEKIKKPDEMVGEGAGIYCGLCLNKKIKYSITLRLSHAIGIMLNGGFKVVLTRNSRYGDPSMVVPIILKRKDKRKKITVYQGDNNGTRIELATIIVEVEKLKKLTGEMGLQLIADNNGMINYVIYDIRNENEFQEIIAGKLGVD